MTRIDQNVEGDGNQLIGQVINHYTAAPLEKERPRDEKILLKAVRSEVRDRLDQSLHNALFINLPKESQPDQVQRPWDYELKVGSRKSESLPSEQTVVDVFDAEEIDNKLLILGQPGAGKTTTLLDLAKTLLARAEKSVEAEIPVLFNLSSWVEDKQSIEDWLKGELKLKYGVSHKLGHQWLEQQKLLPLLDGLDELAPSRQELCVERINQWLGSDAGRGALVVCSRIEEYENYETELALRGAVCLQPLSDEQIKRYLQEVGKPELKTAVAQDAGLKEMLRVPLQMSMAVLVYDEAFGLRWRLQETETERLALLLNSYVTNRLAWKLSLAKLKKLGYEKHKPASTTQTKLWLIWLARKLKSESKDEFLLEHMRPSLLTTANQKSLYVLIFGLFCWPTIQPVMWAIGRTLELDYYWDGLLVGLVMTLLSFGTIGFISVNKPELLMKRRRNEVSNPIGLMKPIESFDISLPHLLLNFKKFKAEIYMSAVLSFVFLLMSIFAIFQELTVGLFFACFIPAWTVGALVTLAAKDITVRSTPNAGILKSRNNTIVWTFCSIVLAVAFDFIFNIFINSISVLLLNGSGNQLVLESFVPTIFVLPVMVYYFTGGLACIQHLSLRLALWATGQIPWNYARFLNHCTDRLLLQRVGGRYRFIHKRLQDHFAAMPLDS